jgi:hypothetical protein
VIVCFWTRKRQTVIVEKRTYRPKLHDQDALIELIKEGHTVLDYPLTFRIYVPNIAPWGVIVHEIEFKDLAERQMFWQEWYASEKAAGFIQRWFKLVEPGGKAEIWNLAD